MSDFAYLAKNTALIVGSKLLTQIIGFLMLPIYTAFLATAEFGLMDIMLTYSILITPLLFANLQAALFRLILEARQDRRRQIEIFTNTLTLAVYPIVILFAIGGLLMLLTSVDWLLIVALGLYFIASLAMEIASQTARGMGNNREFARASIIQGLLGALLTFVALVVWRVGVVGVFLALATGLIVATSYLVYKLQLQKLYVASANNMNCKRELLKYSLPLVTNSISWWVFNASDRTVLYVFVSAAANGIYALSNKFSGVLFNIWGMVYIPITESVALVINKDNRDWFLSKLFSIILRSFASIAALGTVLTGLLFPYLVNVRFYEAFQYIPLLMLAGFSNCVIGFYSAIYLANKQTKEVMKLSFAAALINLVTMLAMVYWLRIWAAVISTVISFAFTAVHRHFDIQQKGISIKVSYRDYALSVCIILLALVLYYWQVVQVIKLISVLLVVGLIIYINRDVIKYIKKMIKKKVDR